MTSHWCGHFLVVVFFVDQEHVPNEIVGVVSIHVWIFIEWFKQIDYAAALPREVVDHYGDGFIQSFEHRWIAMGFGCSISGAQFRFALDAVFRPRNVAVLLAWRRRFRLCECCGHYRQENSILLRRWIPLFTKQQNIGETSPKRRIDSYIHFALISRFVVATSAQWIHSYWIIWPAMNWNCGNLFLTFIIPYSLMSEWKHSEKYKNAHTSNRAAKL